MTTISDDFKLIVLKAFVIKIKMAHTSNLIQSCKESIKNVKQNHIGYYEAFSTDNPGGSENPLLATSAEWRGGRERILRLREEEVIADVPTLRAGLGTPCLLHRIGTCGDYPDSPNAAVATTPTIRLPGHVLPALFKAKVVTPADQRTNAAQPQQPLTLTIVLKRSDQAGFDRYLRDVYDSKSPGFRHFLTPEKLSDRFGPSSAAYRAVLNYLTGNGLRLVEGSTNRLTLTMRGTRAQAERAFSVHIRDFKSDGRLFYANDADPAIPRDLGMRILGVIGLSNRGQPRSAGWNSGLVYQLLRNYALQIKILSLGLQGTDSAAAAGLTAEEQALIQTLRQIYGAERLLLAAQSASVSEAAAETVVEAAHDGPLKVAQTATPDASAPTGKGETIGLLAFSSFNPNDVADWLVFMGLPPNLLAQVSQVDVSGGAPAGPEESEVLLGIDTLLTIAPGRKLPYMMDRSRRPALVSKLSSTR